MDFSRLKKLLIILAALIIFCINWSYACNESVCASVVSKCMLVGSCDCELSTCDCCKDCFFCLSYLYDECCSCFDLCPTQNNTDKPLSSISHVESFDDSFPELFRVLTEDPDEHKRWTSITYPVDIPPKILPPQEENNTKNPIESIDEDYNYTMKPHMTVNCTVAFMVDCNSWVKCKRSCQSMGAASYRWFHDGCCQCVGNTCLNYGLKQSKCSNCPKKLEMIEDEYDDYGEDYDIFDEN